MALIGPLFMLGGFLLADRASRADRAAGDGTGLTWGIVVLVLVLPVLIVATVLAVFRMLARRGTAWLQPMPVAGTDRPRRKRIVRAIRRNEHLDGDDEYLALDTARRWRTMAKFQAWLAPIFGLNLAIQLLQRHWVFAATFAVLIGAVAAQWLLIDRRARRFLEGAGAAEGSADDAGRA